MISQPVGNHKLLSTLNNRLVLQAVRLHQPTYRAQVADVTRLKPPTVTKIVGSLLRRGYLRERPNGSHVEGTMGRPPKYLEINPDIGRALAIDLEPDHIRVALLDVLLNVQAYQERLIDRFSDASLVFRQIVELCEHVLGACDRDSVYGAGVSLPGLIDIESGALVSSTNMPKWRKVPVGPMLSEKLNLPVEVQRSGYLAALCESWNRPQSQRNHRTLVVTLRTGIGLAVIQDGAIILGSQGVDGEIGHTVIDRGGDVCECGSRGCLETFVSTESICRRAQRRVQAGGCSELRRCLDAGEPLTPALIYRNAVQGDHDCEEIVRDVAKYVGIGIANMINLFAAHSVVISGMIDATERMVLEPVQEQIEQYVLPRFRRDLDVRLAVEREKAPLIGAGVLVVRQLFEAPQLRDVTQTIQPCLT